MVTILLVSSLLLFAIGMPVAFAMVLSAAAAFLFLGNVPLMVLPQRILTGADSFPLMAIPFFLLAGNLMISGGLTQKLSNLALALVGHLRGGLAQVNVVNSMMMGGMTGSAIADAVSDCKILVPVMLKSGYSPRFAASLTAASAAIAPMIPPSIPFIIYGSIAGTSIGQLFLAGVVPGIMMGVFLMIAVNVIARRRNLPRGEQPNSHESCATPRTMEDTEGVCGRAWVEVGQTFDGTLTAIPNLTRRRPLVPWIACGRCPDPVGSVHA